MSGAEAITIIGLISSIITIIETSKSLCDACTDAKGLHEPFRSVSINISIVLDTLRDCQRIQERADDRYRASGSPVEKSDLEDSAKAVKPILLACEADAKKLEKIFGDVIPNKHATRLDRYRKAAKAVRPDTRRKVEDAMKDLEEKLQLLHTNHYFKTANERLSASITASVQQLSIAPGGYSAAAAAMPGGTWSRQSRLSSISSERTGLSNTQLKHTVSSRSRLRRPTRDVSDAEVAIVLDRPGRTGRAGWCWEQSSKNTWLLWLRASTAARFDESVRKLANDIDLPGQEDTNAEILQLVHSWLRNVSNGNWVVVLDSADDASFLWEPLVADGMRNHSSRASVIKRRIEFLPICAHGSMIVTTRTRAVASKLVDDHDLVVVQPMDQEYALALLEKKLGLHNDPVRASKLVAALEYMPLAIAQAAAYIKKKAPRCSVEQYLANFKKSEKLRTTSLNANSEELRRDHEAKNSVILTWQISFEHIYQMRRSAADLLSLMSFFDNQGIPEFLLRANTTGSIRNETINPEVETYDDLGDISDTEDGTHNASDESSNAYASETPSTSDETSEASEDADFDEDIDLLRDYLFISIAPDGSSFEMHRLVQLSVRMWLEAQGKHLHARWAERSVQNLALVFPYGDYENWARCRILFPHVTLALDLKLETRKAQDSLAFVLEMAAWFRNEQGAYGEAEVLATKSMDITSTLFAKDDRRNLAVESIIAVALSKQGKDEAAIATFWRILDLRERKNGIDDPRTQTTMSNLANALSAQGETQLAEEMHRRVPWNREKILGDDHPDILSSKNSLAWTLQRQGLYREAEVMYRQVLEVEVRVLGKDHPQTMRTEHTLAVGLSRQGLYKEAEAMYRQALRAGERMLGKEHPHTVGIVADLAEVLRDQMDYKEAERMLRQALKTRGRILGKEHPETLTSALNLAAVLQDQGENKGAESMYCQCLKIREEALGMAHIKTLYVVESLACLARHQGHWDAAAKLYERASSGFSKALNPSHRRAVDSQRNFIDMVNELARRRAEDPADHRDDEKQSARRAELYDFRRDPEYVITLW